jgi:hypothetical protein
MTIPRPPVVVSPPTVRHPQPWSYPTGASAFGAPALPVPGGVSPPFQDATPLEDPPPFDDALPLEDAPLLDDAPPSTEPASVPLPTEMGSPTHCPVAGSQYVNAGHGVIKQWGTQAPALHS